ncbi:hypothetical protein VPR01S_13_00890 [Vibrio proteolyticus NBRC 13287]|uniref:Uncharacterized protein n=1 Tax=Vibrio proteolyticus NBRC 13287 TaxID=1219065 RepID=U3A408_VIBPR|nr:hypothetical protein VPR01S_13_00890 [Vibrio proteolyticus NBRC 13287]
MFKIEFYLKENQAHWSAEIHQLNSDILQRHIFPKLLTSQPHLNFQFCEHNQQGVILSASGTTLGSFKID